MTQITDSMALAFYILHPRTLLGLPRNQLQRAMIQIIQREGWGKGREYQMKLQLKIIMLLLSVRKWLNLSLHTGTHRHTLAPPRPRHPPPTDPASNPGINSNQTKENCLADKCWVYLAKRGIFFKHHTFPCFH